MRKILLFVIWIITDTSFGQHLPKEYIKFTKSADSLYQAKQYQSAAFAYSAAFKANGWKGLISDRYNGAKAWALAGNPDSALFYLDRIATKVKFADYQTTLTEPAFLSLHRDKRWKSFLQKIKFNQTEQEKAAAKLNKPLVQQLDTIYKNDEKYRLMVETVSKRYGYQSKAMDELRQKMAEQDSINLIKVKAIVNQYGWLGTDVVGQPGNTTLFLVIQHADLATQEKYLPIIREAVKLRKADASALALLEDRMALRQGKKQIYGSQLIIDNTTGKASLQPLEDPDNVDKRRAAVGLQPLAHYLKNWEIEWNVEAYKKENAIELH